MSTSAPPLVSGLGSTGSIVSSNTAAQAFVTIPTEDDPTPPNTAGLTLISDLADFLRPLPALQASTEDPAAVAAQYGQDLDFDWDTGEPAGLMAGNLSYVSDAEQVVQWIQKELYTAQGRYPIYAQSYGSILDQIKGDGGPPQTFYSEVSRTALACMSGHPRVTDAYVDSVTTVPALSATGLFITGRIFLDSSDDPVILTLAAS